MAVVGLSEFTFGYGFLYEQTQRHWENLRVAPVLPSLAQEAEDAWDARLPLVGTDFYYQFKLSDYLARRNSLFHRDGTYDGPYYRIPFHRRDNNRQHHRLWQHAQANPHTYYVAPEFNNIDVFNNAFLARELTLSCRLIPLNECEDCADGDQHYLSYQAGDAGWHQHSQRKRREKSFSGRDLESLYRDSAQLWRPVNEDFAVEAFTRAADAAKSALSREEEVDPQLIEDAVPLLQRDPRERRRGAILARTAEVLSVLVGATMVLVGQPAG